ncbi:hypothetical protein PYW07_014275 [Mythimna separata]|uniref:GCF C-terminal domain-containing protein n=1 Tax=Mythimna separata TaxID=271217 RepID=A0AAD7Z0Q0_MYTSE|nr:hypothetical protein PYW07_014275 [Mythimna separata]
MSLFRKPKKIQRRVFCADDDDDGEPEAPPPPVISHEPKTSKKTALLSFADEEEEDVEVFKVKKSSQSKRLAKKREKEKLKKDVRTDGDNNKYDTIVIEEKNNHTELNNDKAKPKKKVTLEGLILSGREALAADGAGDVSDESAPDEEADEDDRGFHRYRAETVRAAIMGAPGRIPDAALIHAARKTRQQARELGGGGADYIPVKSESTPGSRLVRDDGSGDDEEEGRILVRGLDLPSDKPKRGTAAVSEEELDSESEEWVAQQLQKARPVLADLTGEAAIEVNPFSVALPAPQMTATEHMRPLTTGTQQPSTANELVEALRKRLGELRVERETTSDTQKDLRERLLTAARIRESRAARCGELDAAYRRAQAIRGYLTDLIECLDEKMPQLEALEARALALHKRRCEFLVERRRADLRDQAQDVLAPAGRASKPADNEEKTRRAAEREGRRRARRLKREAAAAAAGATLPHRDGDSSDDELPPHEMHHYTQERDAIRQQSASLFSDALPAWRSVAGVCGRLARWRARATSLYTDAYVADCLPKLLAPYVRHELILWNPLADEDNEDYERMDWYKCLMMYGVRTSRSADDSSESASEGEPEPPPVSSSTVRDDPDLLLVPSIISRVVLPCLTELVSVAWDPVSVRACVRLRSLLLRAASLPTCGPALRRLSAALRTRLAAALGADVFLPALPPQVMEGSGGAFWRRCLGAGVRLLRATLALTGPPDLLYADPLVLSLIETLCCGAGAAGGPYIASAASALTATLPRSGALRKRALARLATLATLALSRLDSDNPLHLKALEQARAVIAEAKAVE